MFSHSSIMGNNNSLPMMLAHIQHYATLINLTGIWVIVYLTMVFITLDRFLMVRLSLKEQFILLEKEGKVFVMRYMGGLLVKLCVYCICGVFPSFSLPVGVL